MEGEMTPSGEDLPSPENSPNAYAYVSQLDFEIAFFSEIVERTPHFRDGIRVLANNLSAKGEQARSLELERRLCQLDPTDGAAHYRVAVGLARLGELNEALASLEAAIRVGYSDREALRGDPGLAPLRRDPRFAALLEPLSA